MKNWRILFLVLLIEGVRGLWRWMKNTCLCFLYWCIDWSVNWYPIVFAACLPASVCFCHLLPREGMRFSICPWISIICSLSDFHLLLCCLCHHLLYFLLCSLCHSVICFYQHHFFFLASLSCHTPPSPSSLFQTHLHILLFSSSECEEVSAPPYGLSSSSSASVGGVLHSNIAWR